MVEGWKKETALSIENALQKFLKLKVKTFLLTSIRKDGTLNGVDINSLSRVCNCSEAKIIAAGGVSGLKDLALLKRTGVYGVVIGKALYEGIFTLKDALRTVREA
jgi:phosphoribosylformimino-5-aminoimidazole carboxamide ribotide isomerase